MTTPDWMTVEVVLPEEQVEGAADTFPPEAGSRGAGGHHMGWAGLGAVADHKAANKVKNQVSGTCTIFLSHFDTQ